MADLRIGRQPGRLPDPAFWRGRRVFLTGHTGFKGAWLSAWLLRMGAVVTGFSLAPEQHGLFDGAGLAARIPDAPNDICTPGAVIEAMAKAAPEIVLHLAAQALVRASYKQPLETFDTNVMGTARVLDAATRTPSVRSLVCVTTDKCYENREWPWAYRESDSLGGHDPYSASKACAELVAAAWRSSFLGAGRPGPGLQVATARAGNVIGGGDWSTDRLVPDCIRAFAAGRQVEIRNPAATRPWQHVLEPPLRLPPPRGTAARRRGRPLRPRLELRPRHGRRPPRDRGGGRPGPGVGRRRGLARHAGRPPARGRAARRGSGTGPAAARLAAPPRSRRRPGLDRNVGIAATMPGRTPHP